MNIIFKNLVNAGFCTTLIFGASAASAGQLTGFTVAKKIVKVGADVNLVLQGTAQCGVMIDDGNGKKWATALTDSTNPPSKTFGALYNKAGKFHLTATGKGGAGKQDCSTTPVSAVDITVLGVPPACTFDMAVQKDYSEIGIQVKTCEVSSAPAAKLGNRANPNGAIPIGETGVVVSTQPGLVVPHTKITHMEVLPGKQLIAGATLTVKVHGTGVETQCPTMVFIGHGGANVWKSVNQVGTGKWPRVSTFVLPEAGIYAVQFGAVQTAFLSQAEQVACGLVPFAKEWNSIPSNMIVVEVSAIPK